MATKVSNRREPADGPRSHPADALECSLPAVARGILRNEPLCRPCAEAGFTVAADHLDHIEPAHLASKRFWDRDNIEPIFLECPERKHAGGGRIAPQLLSGLTSGTRPGAR